MITEEDKQEFVKRVQQLVHDSITEHEALIDGLPVEIVDWFMDSTNKIHI